MTKFAIDEIIEMMVICNSSYMYFYFEKDMTVCPSG